LWEKHLKIRVWGLDDKNPKNLFKGAGLFTLFGWKTNIAEKTETKY